MSVCRLCSSKEQIFDVFHSQLVHGQQLRLSIFLATGIEIKETDVVSKMVCHRCCEIAVKLHKYRTNANTNDKLLKDQCGQPYTPPTNNQDEILRVAAKIVSEQMITSKQGTSVSSNSRSAALRLSNHPSQSTNQLTSPKEKNDTSLGRSKIVRKVIYKHPSVKKLYKQYKNIILPVEVLKSDVSPAISLNRTEVNNWYAEQVNTIQKKLTNVVIKRISCDSASTSSELLSIPNGISPSTNDMRLAHVNTDTNNSSGGSTDRDKSFSSYQNESDGSTVTTTLTKAVPQSSLTGTKNVQQRAKKKTTCILHPSRKKSIRDDDDQNEVIPEKKSRSVNSKVDFPSSLELVPTTAPSKLSASASFISSSTSDLDFVAPVFEQVDCQNVMAPEKTLSIFICTICNQICDTKKQLQDHERVHLTCKFCKMRIKNLKSLQQHQNETCFINIVKNPPSLRLTKVDSIKSVVERYPEAFKALTSQPETPHESFQNINVEVLKDSIITEGIKLSNINTGAVGQFASPSDQFIECTRIVSVNKKPTIINTDARSSNIEIVCLTDDSDDDIQGSEITEHPVLNNPNFSLVAKPDAHRRNVITSIPSLTPSNMRPSAASANKGNTVSKVSLTNTPPLGLNTFRRPQSYLNEREMIHSLFRKYNDSSMKRNTSLQTNAIPSNQIKCTSANVIILDDLLSELDKHRIPIHFESKPRISAKFLEQPLFSEEVLETWQNIKVMNLQKPGFSSYVKPIQLTPPVSLKLKAAHNKAKISIPAQKDTCPLILNNQQANTSAVKPSYSNQSSNTTIAKPVRSTIGTSSLGQFNLVALPTTPATIIAQTSNTTNLSTTPLMINSAANQAQQSGYMQIVETPNLISYPTLYIPQSGALIQNTQQNEKVIHVNNNVTNINKYLVLAPGMGQLSGINLDYLNYSSLPLNQTLQDQQSQTNQQQLTMLPPTTTGVNSAQALQTQSSVVRVKNLWELTQ